MKQLRRVLPMPVSRLGNDGNQQQQQMFDINEALQKQCECGSKYFEKVFKVGLISKLAPNNKLQQDITIEVPIYVCHNCGKELNLLIINDQVGQGS